MIYAKDKDYVYRFKSDEAFDKFSSANKVKVIHALEAIPLLPKTIIWTKEAKGVEKCKQKNRKEVE